MQTIDDGSDVLLLITQMRLALRDIEKIENNLTEKIGKKCVIIDGVFSKVLGV